MSSFNTIPVGQAQLNLWSSLEIRHRWLQPPLLVWHGDGHSTLENKNKNKQTKKNKSIVIKVIFIFSRQFNNQNTLIAHVATHLHHFHFVFLRFWPRLMVQPLGPYGPGTLIILKNIQNMLQDHIRKAYCSRGTQQTCSWSSVYFKYGPGAYLWRVTAKGTLSRFLLVSDLQT